MSQNQVECQVPESQRARTAGAGEQMSGEPRPKLAIQEPRDSRCALRQLTGARLVIITLTSQILWGLNVMIQAEQGAQSKCRMGSTSTITIMAGCPQ